MLSASNNALMHAQKQKQQGMRTWPIPKHQRPAVNFMFGVSGINFRSLVVRLKCPLTWGGRVDNLSSVTIGGKIQLTDGTG